MFTLKQTVSAIVNECANDAHMPGRIVVLKESSLACVSTPVVFDIPEIYGDGNYVGYSTDELRTLSSDAREKRCKKMFVDALKEIGIDHKGNEFVTASFGVFPYSEVFESDSGNSEDSVLVIVVAQKPKNIISNTEVLFFIM